MSRNSTSSGHSGRSANFKVLLLLVALAATAFFVWRLCWEPKIPQVFAGDLPANCRQVVLVLSDTERSNTGRLWLLSRNATGDPWRNFAGPFAVTLGAHGMAWGLGEHHASAPRGFRCKTEGDLCSPAGIFRIPMAFGYAALAPDLGLTYRSAAADAVAVDDPVSHYYNQWTSATNPTADWNSCEVMRRDDDLYKWGAWIAYNPANVPGAGSCIFLHIWAGAGRPTLGCTAMAESDLLCVLRWLDPAKEPRVVQGTTTL